MPRSPRSPDAPSLRWLAVRGGAVNAWLFLCGALFSSLDVTPPWFAWLGTFALVSVAVALQWHAFLHGGRRIERVELLASSVGDWALERGPVTVVGALIPDRPEDARRFAYRICIELSEDSGEVTVHTLDPLPDS